MSHPKQEDGPLVKRQRVGVPAKSDSATSRGSRIFAPFRVGRRRTTVAVCVLTEVLLADLFA